MAKMNWESARKRDLVRDRGSDEIGSDRVSRRRRKKKAAPGRKRHVKTRQLSSPAACARCGVLIQEGAKATVEGGKVRHAGHCPAPPIRKKRATGSRSVSHKPQPLLKLPVDTPCATCKVTIPAGTLVRAQPPGVVHTGGCPPKPKPVRPS